MVALEDARASPDIQAMCECLRAAGSAEVVVCDVGRIRRPTLGTVDALARLRLAALRHGRELRLGRAGAELLELLALVGLDELFRPWPELALEPGRQPEQREPPGRVEEEGDPADPVA